jgi:hypothetical protein
MLRGRKKVVPESIGPQGDRNVVRPIKRQTDQKF